MKDAPNHVTMNMIGFAQNSREIFKEGDVPIIDPSIIYGYYQ